MKVRFHLARTSVCIRVYTVRTERDHHGDWC